MSLSWRGLLAEFRQRPLWEGTAGSLAVHLLLASVLLCPLPGREAEVRLPVREMILLELVKEPPEAPQVHRVVEVEEGEAAPARLPEGTAGQLREETVSLTEGGKYERYLLQIKRKIEEVWVLSEDAGEGDLMVVFSVERSGKLSRVRMVRSSGNARLDASALRAVRRAEPFRPMPPGMDLARLHVRASFCYRLASR